MSEMTEGELYWVEYRDVYHLAKLLNIKDDEEPLKKPKTRKPKQQQQQQQVQQVKKSKGKKVFLKDTISQHTLGCMNEI